MGAIAGIWQLDGTPLEPTLTPRLIRSLTHRQPQPFGTYHDSATPLALIARLAARRAAEAAPPRLDSYAGGRYWIAFDGILDNRDELRAELTGRGLVLLARTDGETVLAACHAWGEECQLRLEGVWAFAIWDRHAKTLFLSVDRFGARSLYYLDSPRRFIFASALKAFLALPGSVSDFDPTAVASGIVTPTYFAVRRQSLLAGVSSLPPGYCVRLTAGGRAELRRWWRTLDHLHATPPRYADQVEAMRALWLDVCQRQSRHAGEIGISLSSGLDSSAIAVGLARAADTDPRQAGGEARGLTAFTLGFQEYGVDETTQAAATAHGIGAGFVSRPYATADFAGGLLDSIYHCEQIHKVRTTAWVVAQLMHEHGIQTGFVGVPAVLFGFSQPGIATEAAFYEALRRGVSPAKWVRLAQMYAAEEEMRGPAGTLINAGRLFAHGLSRRLGGSGGQALSYLAQDNPGAPVRTAASPPWMYVEPEPIRCADYEADATRLADDLVYRNTYLNYHFDAGSSMSILRGITNVYEAWGVECQTPYINWRLACFVFSLRDSAALLQGERNKALLRDALKDRLPEHIYRNKGRVGFYEPVRMFFAPALKPVVLDTVHSAHFQQSPFWDGRAVAAAVERIYANQPVPQSAALWRCVVAGMLMRLFHDRAQQFTGRSG